VLVQLQRTPHILQQQLADQMLVSKGNVVGLLNRMERERLIDGAAVRAGDQVLGLASSGLHSNGFSLARRIVFDVMGLGVRDPLPGTGRSVADELLEPTRIYVRSIQKLLERVEVRAMAHVTGGGLTGNVPRVLPTGCRARISRSAWSVPSVFEVLRKAGHVDDAEMFRTFNMGIGMVVIVAPEDLHEAEHSLERRGETSHVIGRVVSGSGVVFE
jgi:phosphoribosylformylglycinamidine cyclo-ligase